MDYSNIYDPEHDFDAVYSVATGNAIARYLNVETDCLDLGAGVGVMAAILAPYARQITCVERAPVFAERIRARGIPNLSSVVAEIEDFVPNRAYDDIVLGNVLHEINDPVAVLSRLRPFLTERGQVHISLQNPHSLHRIHGRSSNLVASELEVSDRGRMYGTQRLWTREELIGDLHAARLRLVGVEGLVLKPYPNAAMELLPPDVTDQLCTKFPEIDELLAINYFRFVALV
jgi:SAM-dependent methyltransferase